MDDRRSPAGHATGMWRVNPRNVKLIGVYLIITVPESGAGDGNRTHASSLGSYSSTIELRPPRVAIVKYGWVNAITAYRYCLWLPVLQGKGGQWTIARVLSNSNHRHEPYLFLLGRSQPYIDSTCSACCSTIFWRLVFKVGVSRPFSMVQGSSSAVRRRTFA